MQIIQPHNTHTRKHTQTSTRLSYIPSQSFIRSTVSSIKASSLNKLVHIHNSFPSTFYQDVFMSSGLMYRKPLRVPKIATILIFQSGYCANSYRISK